MDQYPLTLAEMAEFDFEPATTLDEMGEIEAAAQAFATNRRVVLAILDRSKAQLVNGYKANPDALPTTMEMVDEFLKHAKDLVEMAETAQARLMVVAATVGGDDE